MIALYLYGSAFYRPTRPAQLLEFFGQVLDTRYLKRHAGNDGHAFAFTPFCFSADPDDPVGL